MLGAQDTLLCEGKPLMFGRTLYTWNTPFMNHFLKQTVSLCDAIVWSESSCTYLIRRQLNTDIIALNIWLIFLGYGIADLYMSVNGGGETHIYRFDTKTNALRADLDSIDHLTFEKGSKVVFLFNNYFDNDRRWYS